MQIKQSRKEAIFTQAKQEPQYLAIHACQTHYQWNIHWMCRTLDIQRSSYYKWLNRSETPDEIENHQLANIILEYDETFGHILGYRRMTRWINQLNHKHYNKKRVKRIMGLLSIQSVIRKKKSKYINQRQRSQPRTSWLETSTPVLPIRHGSPT